MSLLGPINIIIILKAFFFLINGVNAMNKWRFAMLSELYISDTQFVSVIHYLFRFREGLDACGILKIMRDHSDDFLAVMKPVPVTAQWMRKGFEGNIDEVTDASSETAKNWFFAFIDDVGGRYS